MEATVSESTMIRSGRFDGLDSIVPQSDRRAAGDNEITAEQYHSVLAAQGGTCAICGQAEKVMRVDYHASGALLGILCATCHQAVGLTRHSTERLSAMIDYILAQRTGARRVG